ncbi:unnamed protein product [Schistosoma margrebowiei]|uniref:Ubiquitin carboxyl-terminal hydrolase n=1 Tax=Schistosoma margrebowiei TaxID=48269 RepID=A0A3P8CRD0_9TREM|nr:unnamed protein product [Schistosoma margrebowiei]
MCSLVFFSFLSSNFHCFVWLYCHFITYFISVADFEYTPTLSLFDLFNIHIYHGWLVDPDEHDLAATVGNRTYNQLTEELLRLESSDNYEDLKRSKWDIGSQLTFHGLSQLVTTLHDEELAVFFRNNHYNTILKHKDSIFVLVTDMGLLNEPNIVWELLNDLDGDTQFVDCSFQLFCPTTSDSSIRKTSDAVPRTPSKAREHTIAYGVSHRCTRIPGPRVRTLNIFRHYLSSLEVELLCAKPVLSPIPCCGWALLRSPTLGRKNRPVLLGF